jgi:mannose-1-phosphate guanylyltransferase
VKSLKALILAGGFATRLRPISCTRPKILLPIVNKPLLQWAFERLAKNNITEAKLAVNYQTEVAIKQHRIPRCGLHVTYSRDPLRKPLGTGGPVKKAEKFIGRNAPFLVLNGDIFADVNYAEMLEAHEENDAVATIALHRVADPSRYGVVQLAENNRIKRFVEKPSSGTAPASLINAGAYVLSGEIFNYIPEGRAVSIEYEVFPRLAEEGRLYGYAFDGLWMDIGKPEDYLEANKTMIASVRNEQKCKTGRDTQIRKPSAFDKQVSVGEKSIIGPNVVLGRNVTAGNNVHIQDSVVLRESVISDSVSIDGAIIGEGVFIGKRVKIRRGCILGDHVKIKDGTSLAEQVSICPAKEISESVLTPKCIT